MTAEEATMYGAAIGVVGTLLGGVLGGAFALWAANSTNKVQETIAKENARAQQRAYLDSLVLKMLEFLIAHPHLEKDSFCQAYPNVPTLNPDARERYESYCCFVFNTLMAAFNHLDKDGAKLAEYLHVDEIVRKHHKWWGHNPDNHAYDQPFQHYIGDVIARLRKNKEI